MSKSYRVCLAALLVLGLATVGVATARAADYYVGLVGSDGNPGTLEAPWASPAYGASRLLPGDRLVILYGQYLISDFEADILRPPSGTAAAWITIEGQAGTRPALTGRDNIYCLIDLGGASYVHLKNLDLTHDPSVTGAALLARDGVSIIGAPAHDLILEDLFIHHLDEYGLNAQDVNNLSVLNCRIEYCGFGAAGGPAGAAGGWTNVTISGTSLSWSGHYYQGGDGAGNPYDRPDGFGIEPSNGPILLDRCRAEHNRGDGLDSKAAGTTIRDAVVANNSCDGVKLWSGGSRVENTLIYGRGDGDATVTPWAAVVLSADTAGATFTLVNCTIDDQLGGNYLMYFQYDNPGLALDVTLVNNIFRGVGPGCPIFVNAASTLTARNNIFYLPNSDHFLEHGAAQYTAADPGALGAGNLYGEPSFVSPAWGAWGDYHLSPGSPAMDRGDPTVAPARDLDHQLRDAAPDLGAYEYRAAAVIPMYRTYNPYLWYHFFTTSLAEKNNAVAHGYQDESDPIPFYLASAWVNGAREIYRLYNPHSGRHYYTCFPAEREMLQGLGWKYEHGEGYIFSAAAPGLWEVYRLYNTVTGAHLYTTRAGEVAWILANLLAWQQHTSLGWAYGAP
ncbi:MAG: right-handed parallel beta-helix repeat-containing protein [Deltaproteobacteria bacterium]|nr:right-handed parallel beta-helix repeat-containing protein [Deltaproteobacteria bacterium]